MEVLYRAENIEISYDPVHRFMYCRWVGFQNTEGIRHSGKIILELFREKNISKVLNDNRSVDGPWQEAAAWAAEEWFPEMLRAGLRHFAWILSENIFAELSARKAMAGTEAVATFYSYEEACRWLIDQPE